MRLILLVLIASVLGSTIALGQIGSVRIGTVVYSHALVGTSAADAILATSVERNLKGWTVCHDAGSASTYLSLSVGVDPDVDGTRLAPGQCFACLGCSNKTLVDLNVKGQAASTGYSVSQQK